MFTPGASAYKPLFSAQPSPHALTYRRIIPQINVFCPRVLGAVPFAFLNVFFFFSQTECVAVVLPAAFREADCSSESTNLSESLSTQWWG